ncbi:hypothetical protein SS50377_20207 [Spironucleus salmonicida]|uniref:Uncharacterized protein n=1 Tax=Spironucleus salmonicida TaxID=348837 RepID=V6LL35_9EUKA|nr:hypothetical protein SS50377_20207 [Spironucleus salmonicida]|eukprot:EST45262.1 Hypothetical protein SS50377_14838 [Spironucleus salmonicida]
MSGINDVIIVNSSVTPIISIMKNSNKCQMVVNNIHFQCIINNNVVYLVDGDQIISPLSDKYLKLSDQFEYSAQQDTQTSSFNQNIIKNSYLVSLDPEFLKSKIKTKCKKTGIISQFSENNFEVTTKITKLNRFKQLTCFSQIQIQQMKLCQEKTLGKLICRDKVYEFYIFQFKELPTLSDIDGTLTPHDILAPCYVVSKLAYKLSYPTLITARSFIWNQKTRKFSQHLYNGAPVLMNPINGIKSHADRAAGKVLCCIQLLSAGKYPESYGNTKSDQLAFNLLECQKIVIV